jgi:beta-phosphoglucomutase-like phosphatase (HAD superfamily)
MQTTNRSTFKILKTFSSNRFSTIQVKEKDDPETPDSTTTLIFSLDGAILDTSKIFLKSIDTLRNDLNINLSVCLNESHMGENVRITLKESFREQVDPKFQNPKFLIEQTAEFSKIFIKFIENDDSINVPPEHHETLLELAEEGMFK